jgi:KipI family sensor histidine kinase inhibitor
VVELVPAARTVLVAVRPGSAGLAAVREVLAEPGEEVATTESGRRVTIPVRYDGADLGLVARTAGIEPSEVIALHSGAEYVVAFLGFAPGFGYLTGLPEPLCQPRLDEARPAVPAGAVAVAGEYTAVYPRASPGGWRLIGRTELAMFDPEADPPAVLAPGDRVRFEPLS